LVHSESNELSVPAPCAGAILRLRVKSPGAFVPEGEVLCELACAGERLQAELTVPQSGVGRLKPGQGVKLLYDAFPYQRYGVRYGTGRWVSPASAMSADGSVFHAFVDIAEEAILVEGQPRPLKTGMRGAAKIVVGRRPVLAYAFEPLRQLKESIADVPDKGMTEDLGRTPDHASQP
jgi:membrane fusion protein